MTAEERREREFHCCLLDRCVLCLMRLASPASTSNATKSLSSLYASARARCCKDCKALTSQESTLSVVRLRLKVPSRLCVVLRCTVPAPSVTRVSTARVAWDSKSRTCVPTQQFGPLTAQRQRG